MQAKKKKNPTVYKPYHKGKPWVKSNLKNALKVFAYFLFFTILYVVVGSSLSIDNDLIRVAANVLVLVVCGGVLYTNGANMGNSDVSLGEIVYSRLQAGKPVSEKDKTNSFHPARGFIVFALAILPILLITIPCALTAEKQVYALQNLPDWVESYQGHDEIYAALDYYRVSGSVGLMDVLKMITRLLVYPYICMTGTRNLDLMLLIDRLSPVLAVLPGIAYGVGYLTGPYTRARVHGDIARNIKKQKRKEKKQLQAKIAQREQKKNELI